MLISVMLIKKTTCNRFIILRFNREKDFHKRQSELLINKEESDIFTTDKNEFSTSEKSARSHTRKVNFSQRRKVGFPQPRKCVFPHKKMKLHCFGLGLIYCFVPDFHLTLHMGSSMLWWGLFPTILLWIFFFNFDYKVEKNIF